MTSSLEYVKPGRVAIAGMPSEGLMIRVATGRALGRLRGFIIDPIDQHLRYFVVRASGLFGKTTLVPAASPRIDFDHHAIEIDLDAGELWALRNFTLRKALEYGLCRRVASASF